MRSAEGSARAARYEDGFRVLQGRREYVTYLDDSSIRIWYSDIPWRYETHDHSAVEYKKEITAFLEEKGHEVINFGTDTNVSCNYAEYGQKVGEAVASGQADCGVLICGTGIGISLAANKVKGINNCPKGRCSRFFLVKTFVCQKPIRRLQLSKASDAIEISRAAIVTSEMPVQPSNAIEK